MIERACAVRRSAWSVTHVHTRGVIHLVHTGTLTLSNFCSTAWCSLVQQLQLVSVAKLPYTIQLKYRYRLRYKEMHLCKHYRYIQVFLQLYRQLVKSTATVP